MQEVKKLMTLAVAVSDRPKAKVFYSDKFGLKVTTDYRQDDDYRLETTCMGRGQA